MRTTEWSRRFSDLRRCSAGSQMHIQIMMNVRAMGVIGNEWKEKTGIKWKTRNEARRTESRATAATRYIAMYAKITRSAIRVAEPTMLIPFQYCL
jgi:hypothetical protein